MRAFIKFKFDIPEPLLAFMIKVTFNVSESLDYIDFLVVFEL